jgi:short-subunit dehydrogenase
MASMGGMIAVPGLGAYHGTKFAMLGMNDSLAQEVGPLGIRVTAVLNHGAMNTGLSVNGALFGTHGTTLGATAGIRHSF